MKTLFILLAAATLVVSCLSRPLPQGAYQLTWTANADPNITNYNAYALTNGAPDFARGLASTNWTLLTSTPGTNITLPAALPAQSLLTVTAQGYGLESSGATPVAFNVPVNTAVPTITAK